jgi:hypothetical protein
MDLCEGEAACVSTGAIRVARHALWTDFLGTCVAAYAAWDGQCALVHYDERAERMRARTTECALRARGAVWHVQRGTRASPAFAECLAALRDAGATARSAGVGARAEVAPQ